jgi:hypothetical protein
MNKPDFPAELLTQHIAIVGKTGSGKTYTAKGFVEQLLTDKRRVCILDPTGVWYGLRSSADGKKPGFPVAVFGGAHADVAIAEHSGAALAKIVAEKNLPAIIDLAEMLIGQRHRFVTEFAEALYRDNRAPLHLVIDEADEFAPQNPLPETKRMLHHVDRIVRRGRVRGFRVMLITQRPAVLHKNVLTQTNALVAMRLTAPQDRKAIQAWVEGQADAGEAREVLASLARLQRGEGWVWAPELGLLTRTTFPKITTFDSGRTPDDDEVVVEPNKLATVDLAEVRASMQVVEQELKTVKELQAELARVKQQLAASQKAKGGVPREAPAGDNQTVAALRLELAAVTRSRDGLEAVLNGWHDRARKVAKTLLEAVGDVAIGTEQPQKLAAAVVRHEVRREAAAPALGPVSDGVSGPQQRILDALAWFAVIGVTDPRRSPLGAVAGSSPKSSGFEKNLSTLRTAGLIDYPDRGRVVLTEAGQAKANVPDLEPTEAALHEAIYRMVSGPQATLLRVLVELRGMSIARDELASRAGVSAASSGFEKNISTLRSFELIDYPQRGQVCATDILFPKGST